MKTPSTSMSNGNTRPGRTTDGSWDRSSHGNSEITGWYEQSVCAFWLGEQCYGLAASLVGEVFVVESYMPVPAAPPAVIGLFNLRGTPVALVDLAMVLELPGLATSEAVNQTVMALVLRTDTLLVAIRIRKMEVVLPKGRGLYRPPQETGAEHAVVAGFLEMPERPDLTITLLQPEALLARLNQLKYLDSDEVS